MLGSNCGDIYYTKAICIQITFNSHHSSLKQEKNICKCIFPDGKENLSENELRAIHERITENRKKAETEANTKHKEKEKKALELEKRFNSGKICGSSDYFSRKGIKPIDIAYEKREEEEIVLIPLRDIDGKIWSLQEIYPSKRVFKEGQDPRDKNTVGSYSGCFFAFGKLENGKPIRIAEGYATALSIFTATGQAVLMCVACGNILKVGKVIKERYPKSEIVICGDDDIDTKAKIGTNPGRDAAEEAVNELKCKAVFPRFSLGKERDSEGNAYTDFDDLRTQAGLDKVKDQVQLKKPRLKPVNIGDFLQLQLPPKKTILSPWLKEKELVQIAAERGLGKTWFALSMAWAICSGGLFLKFTAPEPRRVLYVDGEMAAESMQDRLAKIIKSSETQPPDPSYFKLITPDLADLGIGDLGTPEGQDDINTYIDDFDVLVLDNLSCLVRSGEENSADSWIPVQEWLLKLRKAGKSVIFLHHTGKKGTARGTNRREDVLDISIILKKPANHSSSDGARFEFHFDKSRHLVGHDAAAFEAHLTADHKGLSKWICNDLEGEDSSSSKVIALYKKGKTQREIAAEIGKSPSTVNEMIKKSKAQGIIK